MGLPHVRELPSCCVGKANFFSVAHPRNTLRLFWARLLSNSRRGSRKASSFPFALALKNICNRKQQSLTWNISLVFGHDISIIPRACITPALNYHWILTISSGGAERWTTRFIVFHRGSKRIVQYLKVVFYTYRRRSWKQFATVDGKQSQTTCQDWCYLCKVYSGPFAITATLRKTHKTWCHLRELHLFAIVLTRLHGKQPSGYVYTLAKFVSHLVSLGVE